MIDLKSDGYLAGLADGEGCFQVSARPRKKGNPAIRFSFVIGLRDDDGWLLELLRHEFGGELHGFAHTKLENTNPSLAWHVANKRAVLSLIAYFDKHPPLLKADEYNVWREAVMLYCRHSPGRGGGRVPDWLIEAMRAYDKKLKGLKKYNSTKGESVDVDFDNPQQEFDFE